MNVTQVSHPSVGVCTLTLTADAAAFAAALEQAYQAKKRTYALDGYAQGSAPRAAIEEKEGAHYFYYDAVNLLLGGETDALLEKTYAEYEITPLTPPDCDITQCDEAGVCVTLTVGVLPPVTLGQYKGLSIGYPRVIYPPHVKQGQLEMLRHRVAEQQGTPDQLPDLDDAFAAFFECENMAELQAKLDENLQQLITRQSYQQGTFMLLEEIGKQCTVELPPLLLQEEEENAMRNLMEHLGRQGMALADYLAQIGKTEAELMQEHHVAAQRALRGKLAMHTIAKVEQITVTPQEVEAETVRLSAQYNKTVSAFKEEYPSYMVKNELVLYRTLDAMAKESTLQEI